MYQVSEVAIAGELRCLLDGDLGSRRDVRRICAVTLLSQASALAAIHARYPSVKVVAAQVTTDGSEGEGGGRSNNKSCSAFGQRTASATSAENNVAARFYRLAGGDRSADPKAPADHGYDARAAVPATRTGQQQDAI